MSVKAHEPVLEVTTKGVDCSGNLKSLTHRIVRRGHQRAGFPQNGKHVVQTLECIRERSTLVVIACKLSTIEAADTIGVLNGQGQNQ